MIIDSTQSGRDFSTAHHARTGRALFAGAFLLSFVGALAGSLGLVFLSGPAFWLTGSLVGTLLTIVPVGAHLLGQAGHRPDAATGSPFIGR